MKKLGFAVATIALIVLASEATSYVLYVIRVRRPPRLTQFRQERAALLGEALDARDARLMVHQLSGSPDILRSGQLGTEVLHPYLGFVNTPERDGPAFRAVFGTGISRWGFLDDKDPIQAGSPDQVIVGIFGGSVAWWLSKDASNALISGLKTVPRFRGKEIVIVRAALFGYKQPQQLLALSYLLSMGAHFDIVINLDGFNEVALPVAENLQKRVFPFYPRTWFFRVADSPTSRAAVQQVLELRQWRRRIAKAASTAILRDSVTVNVAWKLTDEYLLKTMARQELEWSTRPISDGDYAATGPFTPYPDEPAMYRDLADKWKRASLQMNRLARANGSAYFHFLQPNQYVAGSKPMSAEERAKTIDESVAYAHPARMGYPYLIAAGRELLEEGVWYQDLTRIFADITSPVYLDTCCHLQPRGNEMLAVRIASAIALKSS